jgi:hypothetical protein
MTPPESNEVLRDQSASRRDIARYLHDTASQSILAVSLSLARLRLNPALASTPGFARAVELCETCGRDLRALSAVLSLPVSCAGDSEENDDPVPALEWYVQTLREDSGLNVTFEATGGMQSNAVALGEVARTLISAAVQRWAESVISRRASDRTGSPATRIRLARTHRGVELQFLSDRQDDPSIAALLASSLFRDRLRSDGSSASLILMEGDPREEDSDRSPERAPV